MKSLTSTMLFLLCASVPGFVVDSACAQDEPTVKPAAPQQAAKAEEVKPVVPQKKAVLKKPVQSIFQKLNSLIKNLTGKSSAPTTSATTHASAGKYSAALGGYLKRQIREGKREIARLTNSAKPPTAPAVETPKTTRDHGKQISQQEFDKLLAQLEAVKAELAKLNQKQGQPPVGNENPKAYALIDSPHIGAVHVGSNKYVRFFATRLIFVNRTAKPLVVKRDEIKLATDDKTYKLGKLPPQVQSQYFTVGSRTVQIGSLKTPAQVTVPAGKSAETWVVFSDIPTGNNVPKLTLKYQLAGQAAKVDVNGFSRGLLGLKVERIGPHGVLGLLTISGSMNSINVGGLVDELDNLVANKVIRVVIRWDKSAPAVNSQLNSWLQQAAYKAGRDEQNGFNRGFNRSQNNQFPIISAATRELHLAQLTNDNGNGRQYSPYGNNGPQRVHKTDYAAVAAALRGVLQVLPRDQLVQEIEGGHQLARVAALEEAGRLSADRLPMILEYTDSKDPRMQRAALIALRHFGEPEAIEKLIQVTRKGTEPMASIAIQSLAGSRYTVAHLELLDMLKHEPPKSKKKIVTILARFPRPIWSDTIYEFATTDSSSVGVAALQGLVSLGHPRLVDVLEKSLKTGNTELKNASFGILVSRTDPRSEELAITYTLNHLKKSPPTSQMLGLLSRTKDRRAIPPLLKHFEKSKSNRSSIINTLATIGDRSVAETFLKQYDSLKSHEKRSVLELLRQLRSPKFRELAGQALLTKDSSLISTACQGLLADGSPEAIKLLTTAFETSKNSSAWSYISNVLYSLGTTEARVALQKGTKSKDTNKRSLSINALRNMRRRSPGYQYIYRAQQFDRQKKWKEAIQQYGLAAKIDPQLPEAYTGRGNALLKQNKFKEAGKDFEKSLKLDEFSPLALAGLGIVRVLEGKTDEGIKLVEGKRKEFEHDLMFAYNSACVYGRALESVKKDEKAADRDKKIAQYTEKALTNLNRSVKLGFKDLKWMKKDPDLKSLHELEKFKKLHSSGVAVDEKKKEAKAAKPVEAPADNAAP